MPVEASYALLGGTRFGFRLGSYDLASVLYVDPAFVYGGYPDRTFQQIRNVPTDRL